MPLAGAGRHLSQLHGLPGDTITVIRELGTRVLNCTRANVEFNNLIFAAVLRSGYEVLNREPSESME
jgi:hypothetical protein